jgi:hypothetical protein
VQPEPDGPAAGPPIWASVPTERTVLLVVQNLATLNRLLDVVAVFADDLRVQCWVTSDLADPFVDGLAEEVTACGLPTVPWEQATALSFDLIVSAGHHGRVTELQGPIVLLSHGIGFSKFSPGPGHPGSGRPVYGLDPDWLLQDGRPQVAALGYSHPAQIEQLAAVPQARHLARLVGDPCYDRILASRTRRQSFRAALGTGDRTAVLISSSWGRSGLLGQCPQLIGQIVQDLNPDDFQVLLVAHPNIWAWHGGLQLRMWLSAALRTGLILVPAARGWQAALTAADCVVGDHGAVTTYGAAVGKAVLLATFPDAEVVPGSAAHRLGACADRFTADIGARRQIETALRQDHDERYGPVRDLVTSLPGESLHLLGALFYELMRLDPPHAGNDPEPYPPEDLLRRRWRAATRRHQTRRP